MLAPESTLATLLSAVAARNPEGAAIRDQGETITWAEAEVRSGQMARALQNAGVRAGDRVGVHYRKCADAFLAMHAVVQQGAVAVPLDPTASAAYLASVVAQTGCRVVLTHAACRATVRALVSGGLAETIVGLEQSDIRQATNNTAMTAATISPTELAGLEPLAPASVEPDQPAYIITTSGSTGTPKGICHSHRSAMAYVDFKREAYDLRAEDRISDIAPNHFDISTLALWVSPSVGATNVVVPDAVQMFPASLAKLAADEEISIWYSVPYLLTQLLARGGLDNVNLSSIRWVLFGGEVFPNEALRELMDRLPEATFSNVYGPAEVNACTIHHLAHPPEGDDGLPIGLPVLDTQIKLVGRESGSSGQEGEIWVSGPTTMLGYWDRLDLDAEAFELDADGTRWYRTGDLGYQNERGEYVFSGRVDHQVKVRGYRVELESIEAILEDAPGVENAVATVARAADGSDVVIAGLAGVASEEDRQAVRAYVADRLPAYALPADMYVLSGLGVTGSGKLDRRALRSRVAEEHRSTTDSASEGTP